MTVELVPRSNFRLYVGIASPLVEVSETAESPAFVGRREASTSSVAAVGGVDFSLVEGGGDDKGSRVPRAMGLLPVDLIRAELEQLANPSLRVAVRSGLTRKRMRQDVATFSPDAIAIFAHGGKDGSILLENGFGVADPVSAQDFCSLCQGQKLDVLFLAACYSGSVVRAAPEILDHIDACICFDAAQEGDVGISVEFARELYRRMGNGEPVAEAYKGASLILDSDGLLRQLCHFYGFSAPSGGLRLHASSRREQKEQVGHYRRLVTRSKLTSEVPDYVDDSFVGRQMELAALLSKLIPLPVAARRVLGEKRFLTLTREGGIGKSALAMRACRWAAERGEFEGGIFELQLSGSLSYEEFVARLRKLFGFTNTYSLRESSGLREVGRWLAERNKPVLLLLDGMDELVVEGANWKADVLVGIITLLREAPSLRILATSRWPVGIDGELVLEVPPMSRGDAVELLSSSFDERRREEVGGGIEAPNLSGGTEVRNLLQGVLDFCGGHPQTLKALARQWNWRSESLKVLASGHKKETPAAELTEIIDSLRLDFEESFCHLDHSARILFSRLAWFPAGIICLEGVGDILHWEDVLEEAWREGLEKLVYFGLLHRDRKILGNGISGVWYCMLSPIREYARQKFVGRECRGWLESWASFWKERVVSWGGALEGVHQLRSSDRKVVGGISSLMLPNWRMAFSYVLNENPRHSVRCLALLAPLCHLQDEPVVLGELAGGVLREIRRVEVLSKERSSIEGFVRVLLGEALFRQGKFSESLIHYFNAWAGREWFEGFWEGRYFLVDAYIGFARCLLQLNELKDSREACRVGRELAQMAYRFGKGRLSPRGAFQLGSGLAELRLLEGEALMAMGCFRVADEVLMRARSLVGRLFDVRRRQRDLDVGYVLNYLAGRIARARSKTLSGLGREADSVYELGEANQCGKRLSDEHPAGFRHFVANVFWDQAEASLRSLDGEGMIGGVAEIGESVLEAASGKLLEGFRVLKGWDPWRSTDYELLNRGLGLSEEIGAVATTGGQWSQDREFGCAG